MSVAKSSAGSSKRLSVAIVDDDSEGRLEQCLVLARSPFRCRRRDRHRRRPDGHGEGPKGELSSSLNDEVAGRR